MKKYSKSCSIYLFRHGQTTFNKAKRFTGWKDAKLTAKGKADAKRIAKKLQHKRIDVAFSSHLSRSKDTLKAVLRHHPECEATFVDDRIIERSYGKLAGLKHSTFMRQMGEKTLKKLTHWHLIDHLNDIHGPARQQFIESLGKSEFDVIHRSYNVPPPGGESVAMVEKRVLSFVRQLLAFVRKYKVNVAVSAHGNSMRPFRRYFEKLSRDEMMKLEMPFGDYFEYKVKVK